MKIYTKTGDHGKTGLIGGQRVGKNSRRIEAYGTADELNAALGVVAGLFGKDEFCKKVQKVQKDLHLVCADLANPDLASDTPRLAERHVQALEQLCDELDAELPPLIQFILPGGTVAGAQLHLARTVARRAERRVIELASREAINPVVVIYLNRLSDLLFLMARWVNQQQGQPEINPDYA